jgi:hypothetical protein
MLTNNQQPQSDKTKGIIVVEAARRLFDLYFNPRKPYILTGTFSDIAIPVFMFLYVGCTFCIFFNYLPLFSEPVKQISLFQTYWRTSDYFENHTLFNLISKHTTLILILISGWVWTILITQRKYQDGQILMIGATLEVFTVILVFYLIRYGFGMFFVKLEQVAGIRNFLAIEVYSGITVGKILFAPLLIRPLYFIIEKTYLITGIRGLTTLSLFGALLIGSYSMHTHYNDLRLKYIAKLLKSDSSTKKSTADHAKPSKPSKPAPVIVPAPAVNEQSLITAQYQPDHYLLSFELDVMNASAESVTLFTTQNIVVHLQIGNMLLLTQEQERSEDFIFSPAMRHKTDARLPPGENKKIKAFCRVSHITYDYLLRELRADSGAELKAKYFLKGKLNTEKTAQFPLITGMSFVAANSEQFGTGLWAQGRGTTANDL